MFTYRLPLVSSDSSSLSLSSFYFVTMASKLKLFQSVQKFAEAMGISSIHFHRSNLIQPKCLFFLFSFVHHFIGLTAFFFYQAKTIQEFDIALHGMLTEFLLIVSFLIKVSHSANISAYFDHLDKFIETRK